MKLEKFPAAAFLVLLALVLAGCASARAVKADVAPGNAIMMKAGNFSFDPNAITVFGPGPVTLTITNTSGTGHNITVKDPSGKVIASAEIPPNATITTQVTFPSPGDYPFFCNHPLHTELGMKGHFTVSGS